LACDSPELSWAKIEGAVSIQEHLQIAISQGSDRVIVALEGELDMVSSGMLRETLTSADLEGSSTVVLDLRGVSFLDSTGLRAIFWARNTVHEGGRQFVVTRGSPQVQRLLTLTRLDEHLQIIDTPEATPT
jgi:anti-sigma B factor antagonist